MIITVCMGSSCFSRGNAFNAETIQSLVNKMGIEATTEVRGCLCESQCKKGPNVRINETVYSNVSPESLQDILQRELALENKE